MKISKFFAVTAAAMLAGGAIVTASHAAGKDPGLRRPLGGGRLLEHAKTKLDLTDEQVRQVRTILKSEKENITGLLKRMREARTEMRGAIRDAHATEATVRAAAAKVADVEADAAVERMKLFSRIRPMLTEDQLAKLRELQSGLNELIDTGITQVAGRLDE